MAEKTKKILGIAGITLAVYLGMKYLLPVVAPFFIAYLLVRWIYPLATRVGKKMHLKKETVTLILLVLGGALLGAACWFLAVKLCEQIRSVVEHLEYYEAGFQNMMQGCCDAVENTFGIDGEEVMMFLQQNMARVEERIEVYLVPGLMERSMEYAAVILKVLGGFFLVFIAVILMMRDYDGIREKLEGFKGYQKMVNITDRLWGLGGAYLKAQGTIMLIVIVICVAGLWLAGNPYALLVGIIIGLLDILPFIGTGTVLVPWAVIVLIQGDFFHAAAYFTIFLAANTAREYLEPRLIGDKVGVYPIVIAMVVYAGLCIYGVSGVILGPLTLLIILECTREIWGAGKAQEGEEH